MEVRWDWNRKKRFSRAVCGSFERSPCRCSRSCGSARWRASLSPRPGGPWCRCCGGRWAFAQTPSPGASRWETGSGKSRWEETGAWKKAILKIKKWLNSSNILLTDVILHHYSTGGLKWSLFVTYYTIMHIIIIIWQTQGPNIKDTHNSQTNR